MSKSLQIWDKATASQELAKRLREAKEYRSRYENHWENAEQLVFDSEGGLGGSNIGSHPSFGSELAGSELDFSNITQNCARVFRNFNFIHSQMSANPPSVIAEPTTDDMDDRLAARAADRLVSHGRTTYDMAESIDIQAYNTLTYGTGYLKLVYDSGQGEIVDIDEDDNLVMEGDLDIRTPNVWNIFLDHHAESSSKVRYVFEEIKMELSHAIGKWPEHKEILEKQATGQDSASSTTYDYSKPGKEVSVYEYWEKGLSENGYDGRYILHLKDGTILGDIQPNPHRFMAAETVRQVKKKYENKGEKFIQAILEKIPQKAELPYHILTHVDIPNSPYGKSILDFVAPIQQNLNRLMLTALDNAAAHGAVRLVLPSANEIEDDSLVNSSFKVIKVDGPAGAYQLHMPALLGDLGPMMDREMQQIDDIMGVNDSQFGQIKRETSNAALQSAAAQGSMIRRRLFNKYTKTVEGIYKQYLKLVRKHFDTDRLYHLIGKEHPLEALEVKTMDLDGGYDLKVTYGTSFSLDPLTRREEIIQLMPFFEKTGVPNSTIADMMQLNELRGMYDKTRVAKERQMEVIEMMVETGYYIRPEPNQDHKNMLAAALDYVMTREFADLDQEYKDLINRHIDERKSMGASEETTGVPEAPALPPMPITNMDAI